MESSDQHFSIHDIDEQASDIRHDSEAPKACCLGCEGTRNAEPSFQSFASNPKFPYSNQQMRTRTLDENAGAVAAKNAAALNGWIERTARSPDSDEASPSEISCPCLGDDGTITSVSSQRQTKKSERQNFGTGSPCGIATTCFKNRERVIRNTSCCSADTLDAFQRSSTLQLTPTKRNSVSMFDASVPNGQRRLPGRLRTPLHGSSVRKDKQRYANQLGQDIEKGNLSAVSHYSINISGMTCSSCAKKALNVLNRITGVLNGEINFIAGTGGFDLDSQFDPMEVVAQFERETGYISSLVIEGSQTLTVRMDETEANRLNDKQISGITSVLRLCKNTYSINFDPTLIGARCVLALVPSGDLRPPQDNAALTSSKKRLLRLACTTISAVVLTAPVVVLAWSTNSLSDSLKSVISFILATCVQAISIPEFYCGAFKSLIFSKVVEVDMLVVISITAAYTYSVVAFALIARGHALEQGPFFETSTLLVTLILFGRLVSTAVRMKALSAVSMKCLQPETAIWIDESGACSELDARLLEYGDRILIQPHTRIVTDGRLLEGSSTVDESMITGEVVPVSKSPGDTVTAGTINGPFQVTMLLTRLPGQNSISDISDMVENALQAKPVLQDMADKAAGWFVPLILGLSLATFVIWMVVGSQVRKIGASGDFGIAITYTIAVLAVSCPCALGLAVPMVLIVAGGVAAKSGIVIKRASAFERAFRVTDVVLDKTGTLTSDVLEVVEETYNAKLRGCGETQGLIFALLRDSAHPVSKAVAKHLQKREIKQIDLDDICTVPGAGIRSTYAGAEVKAGNPFWLGIETVPEIKELVESGMSLLCVTIRSRLIAVYGLKSTLRPEARIVVDNLHRRGVRCHIVSGDGAKAVEDVAQTVGICTCRIASRQDPFSKQQYVRALTEEGRTVLFCGDGTNDAIAIAQADVGLQIGSTSDITRASADIVLTGGLDCIPVLLDISKEAFFRIVFNIAWSGLYNVFAILLAAGAFVRVRIPPAYAGLGEIVSILPAVLVTMTLMRFRRKEI